MSSSAPSSAPKKILRAGLPSSHFRLSPPPSFYDRGGLAPPPSLISLFSGKMEKGKGMMPPPPPPLLLLLRRRRRQQHTRDRREAAAAAARRLMP